MRIVLVLLTSCLLCSCALTGKQGVVSVPFRTGASTYQEVVARYGKPQSLTRLSDKEWVARWDLPPSGGEHGSVYDPAEGRFRTAGTGEVYEPLRMEFREGILSSWMYEAPKLRSR